LSTITIPEPDVTSAGVAQVLRTGLGERYHVLAGMRMPQACIFAARPDRNPDIILVDSDSNRLSNRLFRAQVTLRRGPGQTIIRIRPGGTSCEFPINWMGIVRKIRRVLTTAPDIQ
jgi:hypothetical protein